VIAEIVSLSRYETQVSALMDEDERSAMEFFIACARKIILSFPARVDFARLVGAGAARERVVGSE
jgi:hypothetical protein